MKFSDLKFKTIEINGETLSYSRTTLDNGFTVSIAKESDNNFYNAAIVKDDSMVVTEVHDRTDLFIVGTDYTFDLVDARKVTTFLKQVEKLTSESEFTDIKIEPTEDERATLLIGNRHPATDKILKIIQKITPMKLTKEK
jgi:hypothetical protein